MLHVKHLWPALSPVLLNCLLNSSPFVFIYLSCPFTAPFFLLPLFSSSNYLCLSVLIFHFLFLSQLTLALNYPILKDAYKSSTSAQKFASLSKSIRYPCSALWKKQNSKSATSFWKCGNLKKWQYKPSYCTVPWN